MKNKSFHAMKYLLLLYLLVTVVFPIVSLFGTIRLEHVTQVLQSSQFVPMLKNSAITTVLATLISVTLAFFLAFAMNRANIRARSVFVVLFTIPMLIPSISHGMGLVQLFGDNGILTNLLGKNIDLYGYRGIVMGSVLYSFPVAFLMFYDSFQYEDFTVYEAAQVLGLSKYRQFLTITLPGMRRTIVSAVLSVFTMVFTDYGVPLMTGGTKMTLPVYMYREVIGMMNFSGGAVVGVILLTPAVIAFLLDLRKASSTAASGTVIKPWQIRPNKKRDILVYLVLILALVALCLPIGAFLCLSFVKQYPIDLTLTLANVKKLLAGGIGVYLINSLSIALMTSLAGTAISYFAAYITARTPGGAAGRVLHFVSMLPLAVPGVVLGLSYLLSFQGAEIYGTPYILVVVNTIHFFSSPYLMAYNSLSKFNRNLEDVGNSLGISRIRLLVDVYLPCTISTIVEMYSYFFVNAMITISAVSFLVNFRTTTLSLMIPQLESQSFIEGTAIVSLMILAINLVEKGIAFFLKRSLQAKETASVLAVSQEL